MQDKKMKDWPESCRTHKSETQALCIKIALQGTAQQYFSLPSL